MLPALIVVAVLIAVYLFLVFPAVRRHRHRKLLSGRYIAHRGLHDLTENVPENSLAAFREAVDHGLMIEWDIHITADGEVVVFHDSDLKRVCGVNGVVENLTLAELRACRLNGTDEGIPTLRESLQVVDGKVPLLIEFKCDGGNYRALCEAADTILNEYNGMYLVQSFYPLAMQWYKKNRPDVCRGQLSSGFKGEPFAQRLLARLLFNFLSRPDFVSYDHTYRNRLSLKLAIALGAFPVGWTFRSADEVMRGKTRFRTYIFENFWPDT